MGNATQAINLAAGLLVPAFRANRVRSLRDLRRLVRVLGAILSLAANSAIATFFENCETRIGTLQTLATKDDLVRA